MSMEWLKKYKVPINCLRIVVIYCIFFWGVTQLSIFEKGLTPNDVGHLILLAGLIAYRIFALTVVPAMLTMWLIGFIAEFLLTE